MNSGGESVAKRSTTGVWRPLLAALIPIPIFLLQWLLWPYLQPFAALFFFPAVILSVRVGGKASGVAATVLSVLLVRFFFLPPFLSFSVENPYHLFALLLLCILGVLLSLTDRSGGKRVEPGGSREEGARLERLSREVTSLKAHNQHLGRALAALLKSEGDLPLHAVTSASPAPFSWTEGYDELLAQVAELLRVRRTSAEELRGSSMAALNLMEDALLARDRAEELALQRKAGEDALRASQERLELALAASRMGVWEWEVAGDLLFMSPECLEILQTPEGGGGLDAMGASIHPEDAPQVMHALRHAVRQGAVFAREYRVVLPNGEVRWIANLGRPSLAEGGETVRMVGTLQDVTERKKGEEAREHTVELLRICSTAQSLRGLMEELSAFFRKVTGLERVGVRLRGDGDYPYYDDRSGFPEAFLIGRHGISGGCHGGPVGGVAHTSPCICGSVLSGEALSGICRTPSGTFWTSHMGALVADEGNALPVRCEKCFTHGFESVALVPLRFRGDRYGFFQFADERGGRFTDATVAELEELVAYVAVALAKLEGDQALKESNTFYEQIINSACEGVVVVGADLRYLVWNPYMEKITGIGAATVLGRHPLELFPFLEEKGVLKRIRASLAGEVSPAIEITYSAADTGRSGWLSETCAPLRNVRNEVAGVIIVVRDITQEKQLEEQLRHAQKMEAIGQLAGGVAHDFNNILMVIYGYCNLMRMQMHEGSPFLEEVDQVLAAAERAANLTKSLLAFSRKQVILPKAVDLNGLIVQVERFLTRIIGEDVTLKSALSPRPVTVFADGSQLEQVLMNLAGNARDAMPGGGVLTIETGVADIGDGFVHAHGHALPGRYAFLSVQDTGLGMDSATCEKIFDPFFTTKGVGKGTGLGLSIVYGVVKQHNGYITVSSAPGEGSTFLIYLPLMAAEQEGDLLVEQLAGEQSGTETVLLAEDDSAIRRFVEKILQKFGYTVLLARNGEEAVQQCSVHGAAIDLVVMDMIMPVKSGMEASLQIREMQPGMKILFMSGYSPDLLHSKGLTSERDDILLKPIQPVELMTKVREVLDRAG